MLQTGWQKGGESCPVGWRCRWNVRLSSRGAVVDVHHREFGPKLCWLQQHQFTVANWSIRYSASGRQRFGIASLHFHPIKVGLIHTKINLHLIFTIFSPVTKALFPSSDENVLRFLYEENQRIEPEWYCPVIPTVLANGAEGIGTGWSTMVPNYNPRELVEQMRRLIRGEPLQTMVGFFCMHIFSRF